jgi:hypothetical protein
MELLASVFWARVKPTSTRMCLLPSTLSAPSFHSATSQAVAITLCYLVASGANGNRRSCFTSCLPHANGRPNLPVLIISVNTKLIQTPSTRGSISRYFYYVYARRLHQRRFQPCCSRGAAASPLPCARRTKEAFKGWRPRRSCRRWREIAEHTTPRHGDRDGSIAATPRRRRWRGHELARHRARVSGWHEYPGCAGAG